MRYVIGVAILVACAWLTAERSVVFVVPAVLAAVFLAIMAANASIERK